MRRPLEYYMETSDQSLVGKYYFNTQSTAAWKFLTHDGNKVTCILVRIAVKWYQNHQKSFQPGVTIQEYDWTKLLEGRYSNRYWIVVDDLKAALTLYSTDEPMVEVDV